MISEPEVDQKGHICTLWKEYRVLRVISFLKPFVVVPFLLLPIIYLINVYFIHIYKIVLGGITTFKKTFGGPRKK